jgi:hypothetical protein
MQITTKDIIKILPFEKSFQEELLSQFDSLNPDQKFNIERILWDTYDAFYGLKLQENIELAFMRARENQENLDENFYKRIREQTEKEMQSEFFQKTSQNDLSVVRAKLEELIKKE